MQRLVENNVKHLNNEMKASDIAAYPEFDMRHIMTLKPLHTWTDDETRLQLDQNRILQPGFLHVAADKLLKAGRNTKQVWLTDFAAMSPDTAIYFHICADLITHYQVDMRSIHQVAVEIYSELKKDDSIFSFVETINKKLQQEEKEITVSAQHELANAYKTLHPDTPEYNEKLRDLVLVATEKRRKILTDSGILDFLPKRIQLLANKKGIKEKPLFPRGKNTDYVFLGASSSGKSSVAKQIMDEKEKSAYLFLATDEYREFYAPGTQHHEDKKTDQAFIRTQDSAYLIKEIIQKQLLQPESLANRPNIIIDGVTFEGWYQTLLKDNLATHAIVVCLSDIRQAPLRAHYRAATATHAADRWRHVNTTSLLTGHGLASSRLFDALPVNCEIPVYDTHVEKGAPPVVFMKIVNGVDRRTIEISDLIRTGNFLGKANANVLADFPGTLYFDAQKAKHRFTYDSFYKAEHILNLATAGAKTAESKPAIVTIHYQNKPSFTLSVSNDSKLILTIVDKGTFAQMLMDPNRKQLELLKSILMLLAFENSHDAREQVSVLGKTGAFMTAMKTLRLDQYIADQSNGNRVRCRHAS